MAKIITLSESDINRIISRVMTENRIISEQTLNSDGNYYLKGEHKLISKLFSYSNYESIGLVTGTKVWRAEKEKDTVCFTKGCDYKIKCSEISKGKFYDKKGRVWNESNERKPLAAMVKKLFCSKGGGKKPTPIKKIFTDDQICKLTDDKDWIYAKDEKGVWWASRDGGKNWFELKLPKFQKAVDILNSECPKNNVDCKTKCNAKPLQPGQTGPQVEMWFYGPDGCYQDTGSGGFSSEEECEACKCSEVTGGGQISEEECFKNYPCLEVLLNDGTLSKGDSGHGIETCGCLYGSYNGPYKNCIFYCDGTAWCEGTIPGKGDKYVFECNQNQIDMDRENPKERNVEKPKNPSKNEPDKDQGFPLG